MLIPNNSTIPSTSTKLNFYLAQINRNKNKNMSTNPQNAHTVKSLQSRDPTYKINLGKILNKDQYQPATNKQSQVNVRNNFESYNQASRVSNKQNNNRHQDRNKRIYQQNYGQKKYVNDSLDVLLTDRDNIDTVVLSPVYNKGKSQYKDYNISKNGCQSIIFSNNRSDIGDNNSFINDFSDFSPKSNKVCTSDIQYFDHHGIQDCKPRKKVNWNIKPKDKQRISINNKQIDSSFRQIANQITKLTLELNKNSKKLQQMNKLYNSANRSNPQQSIKRANLKYATVDVSDTNSGIGLKHRPRVQYQDKIYRDPRYLIWQPLHSTDHHSLHS